MTRNHFFEYIYIILICVLFFFCRHVLLVMFIIFSWIVWIQQECVSQLGTTFARFELTDHALNQVEQLFLIYIILIFFFFFPPLLSVLVHFCPSSTKKSIGQIRLAHQDMCGTREILKDGNPLERVTRLGTISNNFSNTRRVEQVRSCAHMTHFFKSPLLQS